MTPRGHEALARLKTALASVETNLYFAGMSPSVMGAKHALDLARRDLGIVAQEVESQCSSACVHPSVASDGCCTHCGRPLS